MVANRKKALDRKLAKRKPGRPRNSPSDAVLLRRAENYRRIFDQCWDRLWPLLSVATTEADVTHAFTAAYVPDAHEFVPHRASTVLDALRESTRPKGRRALIGHFAESLAGQGTVNARSSRDACIDAKRRAKTAHHIVRYEYFVECTCGYQGRSYDHACASCNAPISFGRKATKSGKIG